MPAASHNLISPKNVPIQPISVIRRNEAGGPSEFRFGGQWSNEGWSGSASGRPTGLSAKTTACWRQLWKVVFARRTFDRRGVLQNEANFRSEAGFLLGAAMPTFSLAAGGEA